MRRCVFCLCALLAIFAVMVYSTLAAVITPENVDQVVQLLSLSGHTRYVRDVAFSSDSVFLATSGDDRNVRLWDSSTGAAVHVFRTSTTPAYINSLAFSPDGRFLAAPFGVWDLETYSAVREFGQDVMHVAFSPDGELLAITRVLQPVELLDTATWDVVRTFESLRHVRETADDSFGFEFSPDGTLLADGTLNEGLARIWEVGTGTLQDRLPVGAPGDDVHDVAFSQDGSLLAAGGQGPTIQIFRVEDRRTEQSLVAGEGTMTLDFSLDGQLLAVSREGMVSLWSVETGRRLRTLPIDGAALPVTFSPDGRFIACGIHGGRVSVWGIRE